MSLDCESRALACERPRRTCKPSRRNWRSSIPIKMQEEQNARSICNRTWSATSGRRCLFSLPASRPQVEQPLKEASRGTTGGVRSHRLRSTFVVAQFALSLVLLVGAGLLIRSFAELRAVQPGFDPRGVVTLWQSLPNARYGEV